jgi:hypothetical protein
MQSQNLKFDKEGRKEGRQEGRTVLVRISTPAWVKRRKKEGRKAGRSRKAEKEIKERNH